MTAVSDKQMQNAIENAKTLRPVLVDAGMSKTIVVLDELVGCIAELLTRERELRAEIRGLRDEIDGIDEPAISEEKTSLPVGGKEEA